jgi:hypothetical protein
MPHMADFPRTLVENLSVSRLIIGTNWWLGYSHTSSAKDEEIKRQMTCDRIADVLEVFLRAGVDTVMSPLTPEPFQAAVRKAEDHVGRKVIRIITPALDISGTPEAEDANRRLLDDCRRAGAEVLMPHQQTTDALLDRRTRTIRDMDRFCRMIRQAGMIPGLSTHMPEAPVYADETGLDVATYIQIYNAAGFLMQIEVDWVHRMIWQAKHPVITIKPLAVNKVLPLVGLAFNWATIRPCDMVCVGTSTPDEAKEDIEISLSILERREDEVKLQRTRSKSSVERTAE